MKYERLTDEQKAITSCDNCTWDSPKLKVKIKPMPFLTIDGNVYSPQEQASIRLKYLEDLIEQGKLIELPCKVGDTVYHLYGGTLNKDTVFRYEFENGTTPLVYFENHLWQGKKPTKKNLIDNYRRFRPIADFGVYWFTDYKLAEAKLKEQQNGTTKETI